MLVPRRLYSSGNHAQIGLIHLDIVKFPLGISKSLKVGFRVVLVPDFEGVEVECHSTQMVAGFYYCIPNLNGKLRSQTAFEC